MEKINLKPKLAEAGPGSGKTYTMVNNILDAMLELPPNRFLAAITYTNAATHTIHERLSQKIKLKQNIFVGTIHSFANRFILEPYAELFSKLKSGYIFSPVDPSKKGNGASTYAKNLIGKGIVPYSEIIPIAIEILENSAISKRICERFSYIFIDEFQDFNNEMYTFFEHFYKAAKTQLYAVGDPEQYVMGFTVRGGKRTKFNNIPFFRFKQFAEVESMTLNYRSNGEIVKFLNQFREDIKQQSVKPFRNIPRVYFIPETSLEGIINCFQILSKDIKIAKAPMTRLYLTEENKTLYSVSEKFHLISITDSAKKSNTLLSDALSFLSIALDRNQKKACEDFKLSKLQWRTFGIQLLRKLKFNEYNLEDFDQYISSELSFHISKNRKECLEEELNILKTKLSRKESSHYNELFTSIRKAKGLQADAVLVIAKTQSELIKWLQTDQSVRIEDTQDNCRLGYVAFSRPREMLCIACISTANKELIDLIKGLGITIVS